MKMICLFLKLFFIGCCLVLANMGYASEELISIFPLTNYSQKIETWINPTDKNSDKPLLTLEMQRKRFSIFLKHYFGSLSPWNAEYVEKILSHKKPDDLKTIEKSIVASFDNNNKPENELGYGENFRLHPQNWIKNIATNINVNQFKELDYLPENRAIAIDNLHARVLPTDEVDFYSYKLAGQGFPFDNLQMSSLWAGTPVYILGESQDHAWLLVLTPDYIAWVKSKGIARANSEFITMWTKAAVQNLAAIIKTETSLMAGKQFLLSAYIGSVFPAEKINNQLKLMVPVSGPQNYATVKYATVTSEQAVIMPYIATPNHFANVMQTLVGRPYGWGNMYFYNDCSGELKNLFVPFGIWLPRHSSDQVLAGKMVSVTSLSAEKRLNYLMKNGRPFLTITYIGGHVFMYMGNYKNPNSSAHEPIAMSYQNVWGLRPLSPPRRAVVGKAVFFPILLQYPEDPRLGSMANRKVFQVAYLDQMPVYLKFKTIDLKALMSPDL